MIVAVVTAVTGAYAAAVKLFLDHDSKQREKDREERRLDRITWENHLSQSIAVQSETAKSIGSLVTALAVMQTKNEESMLWARDAMQMLVREIGRSPAKD